MWQIFNALVKNLKKNPDDEHKKTSTNIDNFVFKLHYRLTVWWLFFCVAVIWSADQFGEKIRCTHSRMEDNRKSNEQLNHVIDMWCYFLGCFTLPSHFEKNMSNREVVYPGVGPMAQASTEKTVKLSWYPWVMYMLFIQGCCFYIPHLIWRLKEKKVIRYFQRGYSTAELMTKETRKKIVDDVNHNMHHRIQNYGPWADVMLLGEVLNLCNLIIQWFITDWFIGHNFSNLGTAWYGNEHRTFSNLDIAFPKLAKCTYNYFGPTGVVQNVDIMCVMTHNIVYEKIYLILWFWYIILGTMSVLALVHRLLSWMLHKTKVAYNMTLINPGSTVKSDPKDVFLVKKSMGYREWVFLQYLTENLEDDVAVDLVANLAKNIANKNL